MIPIYISCLILLITAISTESWSTANGLHWGLWKICGNSIPCISLPPPSDKYPDFPKKSLNAVRALMIISAVLVAGACVERAMMKDHNTFFIKNMGLLGLAMIMSMLAMVIWSSQLMQISGMSGDSTGKMGFSWYAVLTATITMAAIYLKYCAKTDKIN